MLPVTIRRVFFAQHRVDFRKGPDGLLGEAYLLGADPYGGKYLEAEGNLRRRFDAAVRELRRAMGITPSSERRRSGSPLSALPPERARAAQTEQERLGLRAGGGRQCTGYSMKPQVFRD